jgi:hypothetical protein
MSNEVYANGNEVSCKSAAGKSVAAFPDVCFTPPLTPATPPGVPIPYPNTGMASDTSDGSKTVQISGKEVMLKDSSCFKQSTGDEAGSAPKKNVITSKIKGKCYYTAWSMDVKFEGENAVRHLDLMTHNHACGPGATPPWPYGDASAFADGGACNKPPTKHADEVKKNCPSPNPENGTSPACCKARRCMMVPYSPNKCCDSGDPPKQMTPHHPVPYMDHYEAGARTASVADREKMKLPGAGTYNGEKAPCICVEGENHGDKEDDGVTHMEHGRIGRAFAHYRDNLPGDTYKYKDVSAKTAEIVEENTGCDKDCIKAQMDDYHETKAKATGDLRKSRQSRRAGEDYYEDM